VETTSSKDGKSRDIHSLKERKKEKKKKVIKDLSGLLASSPNICKTGKATYRKVP